MSPEGEIKKMSSLEEEFDKSEQELKKEGYQELTDEEAIMLSQLPESERTKALINKRYGDVKRAALLESQKLKAKEKDKKKEKKRRKIVKASRKKNRK